QVQVNFGVALKVLVIALVKQVCSADAYQLYARLRDRARSPLHLIAERMNRAPEVVQLQTQDHVRIGDDLAPPLRLVERVLCWEIQATDLVDDRCLKRFGEFD